MKVYSFWHANFKKGWKGVNLRIWKRAGGYLGLDKNDLRVKSDELSDICIKNCDLLGGTSNGVVEKKSNWCPDGCKKIVGSKNGEYSEKGDWEL